jgi:hypothetical protein
MKINTVLILLVTYFISISCATTHNKKDLIKFQTNKIPESKLKLDGYFYREYEINIDRENPPFFYKDYISETGVTKCKTLNSLFIYEDGFTYILSGIDGLSTYYCAEGRKSENSYENAHKNILLMIEAQKTKNKKMKRICDFEPNYLDRKGITEIIDNRIRIQYYQSERQIPGKDFFNSYYLHEMNGMIENDTTFVINEIKNYRDKSIEKVNYIYKYRKNAEKPEIPNYFKMHFKKPNG